MNRILTSRWTKVVVFAACLVPLGILVWKTSTGDLGANPAEFVEHATGIWVLRFLVLTLAITPLRKILGLPQLIRYRRMVGLFAFFYVCLHFSTYIGLDQVLNFPCVEGCGKAALHYSGFHRIRIDDPAGHYLHGQLDSAARGKALVFLHRLVYVSAIAGVIHYYWQVKSDVHRPLEYAAIVCILLAWRLPSWLRTSHYRGASARTSQKEPATSESVFRSEPQVPPS